MENELYLWGTCLVQYPSRFSSAMQILSGQEEYSSRNQLRKVQIETCNQNTVFEYLFISDPEGKGYFHKSCSRFIRELNVIVNFTYMLCCGVQDCINFLSQLSDNLSAQSVTADPWGSVEQKNCLTPLLVPSVTCDVRDHLTAKGW